MSCINRSLIFLQVAGLVAALKMFFNYGFIHKPQIILPVSSQKKQDDTNKSKKHPTNSGPYKPPHLRKSKSNQNHEVSSPDLMSSDSDYSDSDGSPSEAFNIYSSKARVAAIVCMQVFYIPKVHGLYPMCPVILSMLQKRTAFRLDRW